MTSTDRPLGAPHHYTDEEMHNEGVAHEHADVNVRTILAFGAAIAVVVAVSAALMYGLFILLERRAASQDPQLSPHAVTDAKPRGPGLLTNEAGYLRTFRQEETGKLEGYGWMNQSAGVARVPVDVAKKLVVEHGLPVRAGGTVDDTLGTHAPAYGESSGGRMIPVKHAPPQAPAPGSEQQPAAGQQPGSHPEPVIKK